MQKDPVSGALGAVVAEVLGEFLVANAAQRLPELYAQAAAQGPVSRKAIDDLYQEEIKKAVDWSHIGAAGAALVAGQDVNLAARAADNALSHNLGPSVLIGAYMVGSTAWTAYDVYDTYQKEGVEAALEKLVTQGLIDVATRGVFKVAGKLYPHPELAWAAALKHVPFLQEMGRALGHLGSKVQSAFVKKVASVGTASKIKVPLVSKAAEKGVLGEARAQAALKYKDYKSLKCRLPRNQGIDSVFVKFGKKDEVLDVVVVESKYATKGGKPKLAWSGKDEFHAQQLSNKWMEQQLTRMKDVHPKTWKILKQNENKIRFKANVLDAKGVNRWYDYGTYTPDSNFSSAIRTSLNKGVK